MPGTIIVPINLKSVSPKKSDSKEKKPSPEKVVNDKSDKKGKDKPDKNAAASEAATVASSGHKITRIVSITLSNNKVDIITPPPRLAKTVATAAVCSNMHAQDAESKN